MISKSRSVTEHWSRCFPAGSGLNFVGYRDYYISTQSPDCENIGPRLEAYIEPTEHDEDGEEGGVTVEE